jgi:hypothetical protein
MEAETAAAAARQRQEEPDQARAVSDAAKKAVVPAADQADLNKSADEAAVKAQAAREKVSEAAKDGGLQPPDLESLEAEEMTGRGMTRKADDTTTAKT